MSARILIIEDDPDIAKLLRLHLEEANYVVEVASTGTAGHERARNDAFDLIILDLMLPGMNGTDICREIRSLKKDVSILMLTVKSALIDKVLGLELGADDYMTKPFDIQEVMARVRALLRRSSTSIDTDGDEHATTTLTIGPFTIDRERHKVWREAELLDLTPKQFDLLYFLARSPGRAYTRHDLLQYVWGYDSSGYEHTVDTHINRLRSKIEPTPSNPTYILTVWGVGYTFAEQS